MLAKGPMEVIDGAVPAVRLPDRIWVEPWSQPEAGDLHDPRSVYAERYWLGVVGPTSLMCMRLVAGELDRKPDGFQLDTAATAVQLGVSPKGGAKGLDRALRRLERFQLAGEGPAGAVWQVKRAMPEVPSHFVARLPGHLRRTHRADADAAGRGEWSWDRAAAVAAALGAAGEPADVVSRQLRRMGVPPVLASEAARTASTLEQPAAAEYGRELPF